MKDVDVKLINKLDNKYNNIRFLLKKNIFYTLAKYTDSCTDSSLAYIPMNDFCSTIKINDEEKDIYFMPPCSENNYADLSFISSNNNYSNIKACRVKSLNAICIDGNLLTYSNGTINDSNYFVFYSINPNEVNKILIMTTNIYNFLTSNNNNKHILHFNIDDVDKIKKTFNFTDRQISVVDYSKEVKLSEVESMNCLIKRSSCIKSFVHKGKGKFMKTHYGNQYSAFNLISGEIRNFRDCLARNNFFKSINHKLAKNSNINRNCHNMELIVNENKVESYRTNIQEDGWVICSYIPDTCMLINFIQNLIFKIKDKSVKIYKKLQNIFSKAKQKFILLTNIIKVTVKKIKEKFRNKISYFRPLSLYEFITQINDTDINDYFIKHPYFKKIY